MIGYGYVTLGNVSSAINCNYNYCFHDETLYFAKTVYGILSRRVQILRGALIKVA